jgi:hypothetical protein
MIKNMFMRGISFVLIIAIVYILLWSVWKNGDLLARSIQVENPARLEIQVKKVPSAAHWWALPFSLIPDEFPCFRCEFFRGGSNLAFSSHTVQLASFETVSKVSIDWNKQGEAVVYFDSDPVLKCNAKGFWGSTK